MVAKFDDFYNELKTKKKNIDQDSRLSGWSIRSASLNSLGQTNKKSLFRRMVDKVASSDKKISIKDFGLIQSINSVYIGRYKIKGSPTENKIAIYTWKRSRGLVLDKIQADNYCDIVSDDEINQKIKVVEYNNSLVLVFYETINGEKKIKFAVQQIGDDDEQFEKLLISFGVLKGTVEVEKEEEYESGDELITSEKLQAVFPKTDKKRIEDVLKVFSKYKDTYGFDTKEKANHFFAQIGVESGALNDMVESGGYRSENLYNRVLKGNTITVEGKSTFKYCDVIEGYSIKDYECNNNKSNPGHKWCTQKVIPYSKNSWSYKTFTETKMLIDAAKTYKIKISYVGSKNVSDLYDYWYGCRNGNGAKGTGDGSRYKGKGFIQLTGKENYQKVYNIWKKDKSGDKLLTIEEWMEKLTTDVDIATEASMAYWKFKKLNKLIENNSKMSDEQKNYKISEKVNGRPPNHVKERKTNYTNLKERN